MANGRIVLHVHRPIEHVIKYLQQDKERPAYVDDIRAVWQRREKWYHECSNYYYFAGQFENDADSARVHRSLQEYLQVITGSKPVDIPSQRSYFLSLTYPNLYEVENFELILEGCYAAELRVDLLRQTGQRGDIPDLEYVAEQVGFLRMKTSLPIVFTIRTVSQGGKFPDAEEEAAQRLLELAFKLGIEYVDVELTWSQQMRNSLIKQKGYSKIIASHHDVSGDLKWNNPAWENFYTSAIDLGDIVKFVGMGREVEDNFLLESFRREHTLKPLIAINMAYAGQLSRVTNPILTPVTHKAIPTAAAPGQMSISDIHKTLSAIGGLSPKEFFIAGFPVEKSPSPPLHNGAFQILGYPYTYSRLPTTNAEDVKQRISELGPRFRGASITIPLKVDVIPLIDELTPNARLIGAINTITRESNGTLVGDNTDWKGIVEAYATANATAIPAEQNEHAALIIGAGGTSRAAAFAFHTLGFRKIYILNRTRSKAEEVAKAFPDAWNIRALSSDEDIERAIAPLLTISCVPADKPIEGQLLASVTNILSKPIKSAPYDRVLLDAAYRPVVTPMMEIAEKLSWKVVAGRTMLLYQGIEQFRIWTGLNPPEYQARDAVYNN
jgi:pentafunctional AROM polypeptide